MDLTALNNVSVYYMGQGQTAKAESVLVRAVESGSAYVLHYSGLLSRQGAQGKLDEVELTIDRFAAAYPENPEPHQGRAYLAVARGDYAGAEDQLETQRQARRGNPRWEERIAFDLSTLAYLRGKLADGARFEREAFRNRVERGVMEDSVADRIEEWIGLDEEIALAVGDGLADRVERRWQQSSASDSPMERNYIGSARGFAQVGEPDRAQALLAEFRTVVDVDTLPDFWEDFLGSAEAEVALAAGNTGEAVRFYRTAWEDRDEMCVLCFARELANAYDLAGEPDSAIAFYERYLETPSLYRMFDDSPRRALILRRLGELYEERGDTEKAAAYYADFVELWQDADAVLQPQVEDVRERIARLVGEQGR